MTGGILIKTWVWRWTRRLGLAGAVAVVASSLWVGQVFAAPTSVVEFSSGLSGRPHDIVLGPDGNPWFSIYDKETSAIGRVKPNGTITEFSDGLSGAPQEIVVGPDGNLWFGASNPPGIGRIDTTGEITMFSAGIHANTDPDELAVGPEGHIWFASTGGTRPAVGYATTGGAIGQFNLPGYPSEIVAGPDGNMWMTYGEKTTAAIGRIASTEKGTTITLFGVGLGADSRPQDIVAGPDGNLWFIDPPEEAIGRVTPSGTITEFKGVFASYYSQGILTGPDGNLWYAARGSGIGQITSTGIATMFPFPGHDKGRTPKRIVWGADGNLWFTATSEVRSGAVGRMTPTGSVTEFLDGLNAGSQPSDIVAGSDGSLWFTDGGSPYAIGRIVPGDDRQAPLRASLPPPPGREAAPSDPYPGRLTMARRTIRIRAGGTVTLPATCIGGSRCAGRLTLTARQQWLGNEGRKSTLRVVGTTPFSVPGSVRTPIQINLNGRGRQLLNEQDGRLAATLTVFGSSSKLARSQRMRLRLIQAVFGKGVSQRVLTAARPQ